MKGRLVRGTHKTVSLNISISGFNDIISSPIFLDVDTNKVFLCLFLLLFFFSFFYFYYYFYFFAEGCLFFVKYLWIGIRFCSSMKHECRRWWSRSRSKGQGHCHVYKRFQQRSSHTKSEVSIFYSSKGIVEVKVWWQTGGRTEWIMMDDRREGGGGGGGGQDKNIMPHEFVYMGTKIMKCPRAYAVSLFGESFYSQKHSVYRSLL